MQKNIKRIIASLLTCSALFGLFGCTSNDGNKNENINSNNVSVESKNEEAKDELEQEKESKPTDTSDSVNNGVGNEEKKKLNAEIHFINTGNSDAILIKEESGINILIDAGDNDDEDVICNYLRKEGITTLDYLISTHPDADHCGGMDAVIDNFEIKNFYVGNGSSNTKTYTSVINSAAEKGVNPGVPLEDVKIELSESSYIKFYNTKGGSNSNESSLVTLYVNGEDKFLFTGDAGKEAENKIINTLIDVDVLKVGHHGSSTSTSQQLLDKIKPEYAIIQVGVNNKYGHPHRETMALLEGNSIEVHRNDECGDIIFNSTGDGVSTDCKIGSYSANQKSTEQISTEQPKVENDENKSNVDENTAIEEGKGEFVITQSGTKYHRPSCGTIKQIKANVSRDEAESMGYDACKRCNP